MNEWKISGQLGRCKQAGACTFVTMVTEGTKGVTYIEAASFRDNKIDFSRYQEGDAMGFSGHFEMRKMMIAENGRTFEKWIPRLVLDAIDVPMQDGMPAGEPYVNPLADDDIPF